MQVNLEFEDTYLHANASDKNTTLTSAKTPPTLNEMKFSSLAQHLYAAFPFLAVPILLITCNVWWAFTSPIMYNYGFHRNNTAEATGISSRDLDSVTKDFIAYFSSPIEFLEIDVMISGVNRPLLNNRELIHMRDVKHLVRGTAQLRNVILVSLTIYLIAGFYLSRKEFSAILAKRLRNVGIVTIPTILGIGLLLAMAFPALFHAFHVISFSNSFWMLDPRTDYLVRLFTYQFFLEATLLIVGATLTELTLIAVLAVGWSRISGSK